MLLKHITLVALESPAMPFITQCKIHSQFAIKVQCSSDSRPVYKT